MNRKNTDDGVALTPNIGLVVGRSSLVVGQRRTTNSQRLILVELTGIEPVASWLQTRRSPS
jgi:hypothetical protein